MESDTLSPEKMADSRRLIMPSWVASAVIHAALLIVVGLMWKSVPRGVAEEPGRATGIVLRKHTPQGDFFEDAEEIFAAESSAAASNSPPKTELSDEAAPEVDLAGLIPKPPKVGAGGLGGDAPGVSEDPTKGHGRVRLPGGKIRTNIYGLEGEGSKFVYVFDRSESMYGRQLASAKAQLIGSLDQLERLHQFGIIFYNDKVSVFNSEDRLSFGDEASKTRAKRFVKGITAAGATNHYPALIHAVNMSPDVIFLLTDGEQHNDPTPDELRRIRVANSGTQIHVIQFVQGNVSKRGNALVRLAKENGGQHKYVNTWKFK